MRLPPTNHDGQVYAGTCGGTFLSIFSNMFVEDLVRTVILAVVGAVVSFGVSLVLKRLIKRKKRPPNPLKVAQDNSLKKHIYCFYGVVTFSVV